jgi:PleD family two-component response regulator
MGKQERASILIVDDSPGNLLAYRTILADLDQFILCASSGEEALRYLLETDFALVILDVKMPGMDGFEVAELMRQRERSSQTPILFLTGHEKDDTQMQQAYKLGAIDYLVKPIAPEVLRIRVANAINLL